MTQVRRSHARDAARMGAAGQPIPNLGTNRAAFSIFAGQWTMAARFAGNDQQYARVIDDRFGDQALKAQMSGGEIEPVQIDAEIRDEPAAANLRLPA